MPSSGERVGVGERRQVPVPLRIVQPVHFIAGPARRREFAKPVVAGGRGAMSDDFKAVVAEFRAGLQ